MGDKIWRKFDFVLQGATLLLIGFGVAMVYSATIGTHGIEDLATKQAIYASFGLMLIPAIAAIDYRILENVWKPIYLLALALLLIVLFVGEATYGARRWIDLKLFSIQPSELTKVLIIVVLAKFFADREDEISRFRFVLLSLALIAPPVLLIYLQPDLGTAIIIVFVWFVMAVMAGIRLLHLIFLGLAGLLATPLIWFALEEYMRHRILIFFNPSLDPGAKYNIDQALISIGSGGLLGKGFASGSQSQLHFLRVRHTDFIFSVIGEEMGLLGALLIISLLVVVLMRILRAAELARDTFGRLIASGVGAIIFFQSAVSIGMNLGLLPVVGLSLPFVCYGGSSLITLLFAEGLVQGVVMRHKKIEF
jgi:rod shape determining protein RodA